MPLFVTCAQGVEKLLCDELAEIGFSESSVGYRGVHVRDDSMEAIYKINYRSRLGGRVLLPLTQFRCYDQKSLYFETSKIDWHKYLRKGQSIAIDANVHHPLLRNSLFAAQVTKDAICDQLRERSGWRPDVDLKDPDLQLNLFIHQQRASLSFDTSGSPLYKRGYRQDSGPAPIQESLAAALLRMAGYQGSEVILDPCCGSGTLLIEAALIASRTPPGYLRTKWGFMSHPDYDLQKWLKVKNEADDLRQELPVGHFFGCEIDSDVARICKDNLRAAGFQRQIEILRKDFSDFEPNDNVNFLITNPPYGKRLSEIDDLRQLYRSLGEFMKRKLAKPSRGFIFTGSSELAKEVGLAAKRRHVVSNSGIDSRLLEYDLY
jgi:putative N6-adenine-specific DNA methylase